MASIGHVAVGTALGSPSKKEIVFYSALALLPDADVIGFTLNVPYEASWGHRGATHSFVFALVIAAIVSLGKPRVFLLAAAALLSHGLLDAMTTGGLGPALLWPFSDARYFLPLRPIPVAPIGLRVLSPSGLWLMAREALLFAPFWIIAAYRYWSKTRRAA